MSNIGNVKNIKTGRILKDRTNTGWKTCTRPTCGTLSHHEHIQCVNTPCLFMHRSNGVAFTLVVDNFLIESNQRVAAEHLLSALRPRIIHNYHGLLC